MEKTIEESRQGESLILEIKPENRKKLYIESYGCAMNFSDSEVVASILATNGYNTTTILEEADLVLVNTCSIRDKAEQTVRKRLEKYNAVKRRVNPKMKVGVLGCMAERLKSQFLDEEKIVDLVVGPDAYKDLPNLLEEVEAGNDAILGLDPFRMGAGHADYVTARGKERQHAGELRLLAPHDIGRIGAALSEAGQARIAGRFSPLSPHQRNASLHQLAGLGTRPVRQP